VRVSSAFVMPNMSCMFLVQSRLGCSLARDDRTGFGRFLENFYGV
jgi:hypothetical protein